MKHLLFTLALLGSVASASAQEYLEVAANPVGAGKGKKIVLVAGDEEYRTEESMPMLAKILAKTHGFNCIVLFSTDEKGGYIDPNNQKNIRGTEVIADADLLIIGTRFRQLPDESLAHFAKFLNAGKPVIGFRTATHAFTGNAKTGDFKWSEFGLKILGEKWVSHHGQHKKEGTRSVVVEANGQNEILRGVGEIFCTTDVYGAPDVKPESDTILLRGAVTESLDPKSKAVTTAKNDPMQPIAWLHDYTSPDGKAKGRSFCTTMGASMDYTDENLRRLIVNAAHSLLKLPVPAKADVAFIDPFKPSAYGFIKDSAYFKQRNLKPGDFATGSSPSMGTPDDNKSKPTSGKKADAKKPEEVKAPHQPTAEPAAATSARPQVVAPPSKGEHIVLIGNGLAERDTWYSQIETELQLRYPDRELFFRNMGHVGDTPGFRPHPSRASQWAFPGAEKFHPDKTIHNGQGFFSTPDQWLTHLKADTIVAFFGYNESFDGPSKVGNFEAELDAWVVHTLSKAYNGKAAPRVVLVSPIAYENQSAKRDLPKGDVENANLLLYAAAIEKVAKKHGLTYIDLFTPTQEIESTSGGEFFTSGGFIPTEKGYAEIGKLLATGLYGHASHESKADPKLVREAVKEKDWFWNTDYNILNGVHAHGRRYNPYGPQNYPDEVQKSREMTALRDNLIHAVATGKTTELKVDDSKTHVLPPVPTNYVPSVKNGSEKYLYGEEAVKSLTVPEGYKVELFASEKEFPNLANPMQMSFDNKGRLWVATMPTYPHYRPGDAMPDDKILIYEDTNNDGKADKETVFADKLHLPIGFEFATEGVYVTQEPNLVLLRDTNGDDKADSMEIVLGGFDTHDTHHAISAFTADPSGAFMLCEGVFLHSNVETPYGPVRCVDGGFFRYSPQRGMLERTIQMSIPNPWGFVFDQWGQDFLLHTSGTTMNWALPVEVKPSFGSKTPSAPDLVPDGHKVRPTSGLEIVSSRHFPDEVQGDLIYCNAIGFLGIKQVKIEDNGTGWKTAHRHDLLTSKDGNFRPVDLEFAPDGSLYVIDWHNVLIGHMQHNARDPLRDHVHGRIYRITYPGRPLVKPAQVAGAPLKTLFENLKEPELRTRYRTRRELRAHDAREVLPAVKAWAAEQQATHAKLEALWVTWGLNEADEGLLREMLASPDFHARAAAVRVLRYNTHRIADHVALLEKAAADEHGRVRLEAVVAASWLPNIPAAKNIVAIAAKLPQDDWNKAAIKTAADRLAGVAEVVKPEHPVVPAPGYLSDAAKKQFKLGQDIYFREGHCVTCHQPNGAGLDPAFPSIVNSPWVTTDRDRLIKIAMYGLMGPIKVGGKEYNGQVPMTPFGGMLKDDEIASVLTFVRNHFGNKADPITPEEVKAVRSANPGRMMLFTTDELLKLHPMK
ncbi:PVC-type heme-binding CxxCH protein [Prosthecobacter sp.]|uniref:PVC-type heme-binding CxxCH protein n=1 Tax=Prosthecobacter sp. TaxID=1965333 RepID=UPI003784ABD9